MKWNKSILFLCVCASLLSCTPNEPDSSKVVTRMGKSAKRGVSFSFAQTSDLPLLSDYISWDYNWGPAPTESAAMWFDTNDMDFCPMCWNGNYDANKIRAFVAAHPKTKYLLAFNEPNLTDQANMTPKEAAALWPDVVALAKELKLKLVSPAMNYGTLAGYSNPIKWLDEFFAQPGVSLDDVYAISVHCYMASSSAVQGYIEMFEKYNKPIWLTEFCAWDPVPGSVNTQMDYLCAVLHYLESRQSVERYAWFIPRASGKVDSPPYMQLLTHDYPAELTDLGKMFCWFSPMDSTVWLRADRPITAGEYVRVANYNMPLRPSTDSQVLAQAGGKGLMITNFSVGQQLTYQVYVPEPSSQISLRYCGYSNSICEVTIDGKQSNYIDMPRNGTTDAWAEASIGQSLSAGRHTITLSLFSGNCYLSALKIQ